MADTSGPSHRFKIWNSKHALTVGLIEQEVETCINRSMVLIIQKEGAYPDYLHGEGKQWHRTREEAVKRAEELRKKKIASLNQQLKKLKALKF